ncbi:protocadherin beta-16-like, partial [Onychostruthus taczanowskii]|uniref:protocadherin beta-16-like n=1 Tax=Onychostruthus taczanowskii TaxID=356909 RepID=UPI001B80DFE2
WRQTRQVLCLSAFLSLPLARAEPIRYSVAEEAESGSLVGKLAEDAGLTPAQLSARRARLVSEDGRQHFRFERASGRLVVAGRLDREELCGQSATCMLPFELLLSSPLQFFRVEVALEDINDHSPIFRDDRVSFRIPEKSDPGSRFPLDVARDLDIGSNTVQAYSISPENEYFTVSYGTGITGKKYLELVLEKPLDREEQEEVSFSVIAMDGGSPPRTGTTEVKIVILDVNDNAPIFSQEVYTKQVLENMPEGSVVLTVLATDPDAGVNGDISYQLNEMVGHSESAFLIDPITGEIKLTKPLDFEEADTHELSVRATDGGGLSAICKVLVEVVDVNDNAPELVVSSFSSPLPENTVPGTVVALFTVRDRDSGANGKISCALEDQLSFSLRPAYKNYYELVTVSALDREETPQYILSVTAADAGSPPLTSTQTFTVDISDVNDNAPVFNQTSYSMYVRENSVPTVFVGAVSAADADVGLNAKVTYSLAPEQGAGRAWCSCISVDSEKGHVFVLRPLDYEHLRQTEVTVSASDAGSPPLRANVSVRLVVLDENDNAPLVLYPAQDGSPASSELVPVSAEAGYLISKVVAVDADSGQNSWLSYHLLRASDPGLFSVGLQSGEVRLRRPVTERDSVKQKLVVLVRDNGKPPLSATAALSALLLKDFSDVRLPHSSPATEDQGGSLTTYLIISLVFVSLLFLISTAVLVARKACRRKELKAGPVLYAADTLQSGLADAAAAGTLPRAYCYEISLTTGSGNSEFKFLKPILPSLPPQHCAVGQGNRESSARRARLVSEDGRQHFRFERASGRLVVAGGVDREELCGQSATCMLPFELLLSSPLQFFRVEVALEDINDHSPVFPKDRVTFDIPETSESGSHFLLEEAQDLDSGINTSWAYSISPENEYFTVSYGTGITGKKYLELVLEKPLDREEQEEVSFSVIAMDGGSPPRTGTTEVKIVILDVNDNAPIFSQEVYTKQVLENMPEGSVVLTVLATDPDAGVNGDISYQLNEMVGHSESAFLIDPITGEIKLTKPLDFEEADTHELSVRATDGGGLSAICKVLVEVVDVNDNAPELVVSSFSSPLPENTVPGTVVALFTVRDRDSGANGKISCALEDQLSFSLRPAYKNYYELVTVSALDREETPQYILSVTAADAGSPPLTSTQTFTVDISDVNDNAPVFNQTSYSMYVRENSVPTVFVGAVSAADADVGLNAKVTYSLAPEQGAGRAWCSCISVDSEKGHVFVLRPLDYEHLRQTEVTVSASDAGSPPLRANVSVRLVVLDENDNAPLVLYPAQDGSPASSELVPVSAEAGYLISKVVAVDADSGQNSWLSYHLLRASDPGLFSVGLQSGEVRLRRPVTERDSVKQKLVVLVRDNGKPPLSATAALSALLLKDFSDVRLPHSSPATEDQGGSLTTYLIISLVFVSLLFLISTAVLVARKACRRKELKAGPVLYAADTLQ